MLFWIINNLKTKLNLQIIIYRFLKFILDSVLGGYGFWPLENKTACYELPVTTIKWTSFYALVPLVLAIVGILLTLFVFITFIRHLDTPIVKASGLYFLFDQLSMLICRTILLELKNWFIKRFKFLLVINLSIETHLNYSILIWTGRELSFILLFGLICCFSMTFVLLAPPTTYICAIQRFGVSIWKSIICFD